MAHRVSLVVVGISAEGRRVVYRFSGRMAETVFEELGARTDRPEMRLFPCHEILSADTCAAPVSTVGAGKRTCAYDTMIEGNPAKARFTLTAHSRTGGAWRWEVSIVGGPWMTIGEGRYRETRQATQEWRTLDLRSAAC